MVQNSLNAAPVFSNPNESTPANICDDRPRIYVACLASYNNGRLYGCWIDATQEVEAILEEISIMLSNSPEPGAEEYEIHDYEGFYSLELEEYAIIDDVNQYATFVSENGELGAALIVYYGGNLKDAKEAWDEHYQGKYNSKLDYATELFEECHMHEIPDNLQHYIDYEKFQRNIFIDSYFSLEINGYSHIFSRH